MSGNQLDEITDELYGLPPDEFVAARNLRAKEARSAGDRETAAAISRLAKPTRVAWLTNQLVRRRRDEVQPLLDLGAGLREATASLSGEDLRRLTRQQHQLVHALVQQAKSLAAELGQPASDDVADGVDATLRAALADDALAAELSAARLTDKLEYAGFGGLVAGSQPLPQARKAVPAGKAAAVNKAAADQERIEKVRRLLEEARAVAQAAGAARQAAQELADESVEAVRQLRERLDRLRAELDQVGAEHADAERRVRAARTALQRAEQTATRAGHRLAEAAALP
jgi:hypothetical protein